jgi:hypothetical protein
MSRRDLLVTALVSCGALACGGPPADTPSAVILLSPESICQGDAYRTPIHLDGTMSSHHLSLVPLPPEDSAYPDGAVVAPLTFAWSLDGDATRITSGTTTSSMLTVTAAGTRPLHISLTTTNLVGGSATSLRTLSITLPTPWPSFCSDDGMCPGGSCVGTHCEGSVTCSMSTPCANPCFVCDATSSVCVPRAM